MSPPALLKTTVPSSSAARTSIQRIFASSNELPRGSDTGAICHPAGPSATPLPASRKSASTTSSTSASVNESATPGSGSEMRSGARAHASTANDGSAASAANAS